MVGKSFDTIQNKEAGQKSIIYANRSDEKPQKELIVIRALAH